VTLPPFVLYLRVRYGECDAQRVVFNSRYADYIDVAVTEFMRAIGYGSEAARGDLEYQLVKQTIEWKAPVRFDDVLALSVEPVALGNTSFTLRTTFRIAGSESVTAVADTIYVLLDTTVFKKTPLPPSFQETLTRAARGVSVDYAAYRTALEAPPRPSI
jgi:acyl-CoA thioester hydrolase